METGLRVRLQQSTSLKVSTKAKVRGCGKFYACVRL